MASGPITSWQTGGRSRNSVDLLFLGSKITADRDCSHDIKRYLLLGRKAMKNLNSVLKSRDITLPTKVHIVKAITFPAVMYRCESLTIKKAEHRRTDAFKLWCWRRLESPLNSKEISPEYSPEGLMLKLKLRYFGHPMWGKFDGRRRRGQQKTRWLGRITDSMDISLSKLQEIVKDREAWCAVVHRVIKGQTWLSSRTTSP